MIWRDIGEYFTAEKTPTPTRATHASEINIFENKSDVAGGVTAFGVGGNLCGRE